MKFDPEARHGMAKKLVVGDSGNPAFFITDQKLVLAETHHIGGPGAGPYFGDPAVQQSVIKAVKDLDPNYQISTQTVTPQTVVFQVPVDEFQEVTASELKASVSRVRREKLNKLSCVNV